VQNVGDLLPLRVSAQREEEDQYEPLSVLLERSTATLTREREEQRASTPRPRRNAAARVRDEPYRGHAFQDLGRRTVSPWKPKSLTLATWIHIATAACPPR